MFDCFLSFYGVRLNTFASLLLNQDSHVTNITVLIVVYIDDLLLMLLYGNILHHNHVFIPIVPLLSDKLSLKRGVDLYKVHKYKSIAHRIKPVDGGITMETPLISLLACAIGRKQLKRKSRLYSHNKQTLSVKLLVSSKLKLFRCPIHILSPDLYQILDVESRHLVRKFGDVQTGRPKTFTFPSHCLFPL